MCFRHNLQILSFIVQLSLFPRITGRKLLPGIPHVAIFDTAFHQTMPVHAHLYTLTYEWYEKHGTAFTAHRIGTLRTGEFRLALPLRTKIIIL
jgi:hypothetical protein